jgi:bifunctional non-homologous end joining protein LigD
MLWRARKSLRPEGFVEPCLPRSAAKPPSGPEWIHEIKHDGYRTLAWCKGERVRIWTRNGDEWTERPGSIAKAVAALECRSCLIDGETIACDENGLAVLELLRDRRASPQLVAFDLLELNGTDLRNEPLEWRKARLRQLIGNGSPGLVINAYHTTDGPIVYQHACALGCEGTVSKRLDSRYVSGATSNWIKVANPAAPAAVRARAEDRNGR